MMTPLGESGLLHLNVILVLVGFEEKLIGAVGTIKYINHSKFIILPLTILCCGERALCRWSLTYSVNE